MSSLCVGQSLAAPHNLTGGTGTAVSKGWGWSGDGKRGGTADQRARHVSGLLSSLPAELAVLPEPEMEQDSGRVNM